MYRVNKTANMMNCEEQFNTVVDLRGAKTPAQKRAEEIRLRLKEEACKNEEKRQEKEDNASWNDVISGVFRLVGIVLIVSGSWTYLPKIALSLAYFTDTEGSSSFMQTGFIDLIATSSPEVTELECGGMKDPEVYIQTEGNKSVVSASTTGVTGNANLCGALNVDVRENGTTLYSGALSGFNSENIEDGTMRFIVSLDTDAGPFPEDAMCTTTISYLAVQKRHGGIVGFSDMETVDLAFSVDTESCDNGCDEPCNSCGCCGDLFVDITNINNASTTNDLNINVNTGGNTANGGNGGNGGTQGGTGGDGGDGGNIQTGSSSASVIIENIINTASTTISQNGCCDDECDECENEDCNVCEDESVADEETNTQEQESEEVDSEENLSEQNGNTDEELSSEDMIADMQNQINEQISGMLGDIEF
jgi:hypothetical protein